MGSFAEATSWRIHEQTTRNNLSKKQQKELSISRGRSMCAQCHHQLAWYDLIPLVSWLSLVGKCRYCHKPIGWHAPLMEVVTAGLFVISWSAWPFVVSASPDASWVLFAVWLSIVVHFVILSVYDLRWMMLPDRAVASLIAASGLFWAVHEVMAGFVMLDIIMVLGAMGVSAGLFWVLYQISHGEWIGGGDVKLGVPLGILVSEPIRAALMLFVASLLGTIVGITLIAQKRSRTAKIPFGPFLIAATVIVVLFGDSMIDWYLKITLGR
ncbi:prepilin peptidase [Candidatus Saccharibacteria bacterium]|nr:prepilin peptidase [Candidatus Saccharibacteria bacterium]